MPANEKKTHTLTFVSHSVKKALSHENNSEEGAFERGKVRLPVIVAVLPLAGTNKKGI